MPYINPPTRDRIDGDIKLIKDALSIDDINDAGSLNYIITSIIHRWIDCEGVSYQRLNDAIGVLECAKMELYRVVAAPYEDTKREINGSVSDLDKGK